MEDEAESSDANAENTKKGPGRPRGSDSWGAVLKLRDLVLDDGIVHHLRNNVHLDPSLFLHQQQPDITQPSTHNSTMDTFVHTCVTVRKLSLASARTQIISLMNTLVVGDLGRTMFGPGAKIRGQKIDELRDAVVRRCNVLRDDEKEALGIISAKDLNTKVRGMITMGDRLVWFCQQFSTGSLFFLAGTLTEFL